MGGGNQVPPSFGRVRFMCTVWPNQRTCWMKGEYEHGFFHGFSLLPSSPVATKKSSCVMVAVCQLSSPQLVTEVTPWFGSCPPAVTAVNFTRRFHRLRWWKRQVLLGKTMSITQLSKTFANETSEKDLRYVWNGWLWLLWGYFCRILILQIINWIWSVFLKENAFCSENPKTASFRDLLDFSKVSPQSESRVKASFSRLLCSSVDSSFPVQNVSIFLWLALLKAVGGDTWYQ